MKKVLILGLLLGLLGCAKDEEEKSITAAEQLSMDISQIQDYLSEKGIDAVADSSGLYYAIQDTGVGLSAALTNTVTVDYTGKFLVGGAVFDQGTNSSFPLSSLIEAWQIGIPLIKEGGQITLYVPSGLAYGRRGNGPIGPNTNLIFRIELKDVD